VDFENRNVWCPRVDNRIYCDKCGYPASEAQFINEHPEYEHRDRPDTGMEDLPLADVIEQALYTDDHIFGDIQWAAEQEMFIRLKQRFPRPKWARIVKDKE
jgi:hypothetical protein